MLEKKQIKSTFFNLDHVAIVVRDIDKTIKCLETMGIGPFYKAEAPPGASGLFFRGQPLGWNFREYKAKIGDLEVEIFEPDDKPSPWKEFLDTKGEGIHHLGFYTEDVEKSANKLADQGAELILTGKIGGKLASSYFDLKVGNIFVHLVGFSSIKK
jgi:methylmalonyl-CoA/ethylmalonyl-CoA epimerase